MPTPWEWNSRILREQEAALAQVESERQRAADDRARRAVVGDEDGAGETDGPGFWGKVRELASQAWGERGAVFKWGAASALDEIAETTKEVGAEQSVRIDAIGERMGVEPQEREIFSWREGLGVQAPETAGGNMAAAVVQVATGAGAFALTGGRSRMAGVMGAGPAARAAGTGAGGTAARAAEELTTGKAASAFALSDYAAFAAEEERALVALNEMPGVGEFIPDMLAQPMPEDASAAEERSARALEGWALGGVLGAGMEVGMQLVRRSKPGLAHREIEAPNREEVREQIQEETVRAIDATAASVQRPPYEQARILSEKQAQEDKLMRGRPQTDPESMVPSQEPEALMPLVRPKRITDAVPQPEEVRTLEAGTGAAGEGAGAPPAVDTPEARVLGRIDEAEAAGDVAGAEAAREDLAYLYRASPDRLRPDTPPERPLPEGVEVDPWGGDMATSFADVGAYFSSREALATFQEDMRTALNLADLPPERAGVEPPVRPGLREGDPGFEPDAPQTEADFQTLREQVDPDYAAQLRTMLAPDWMERHLALATVSATENGIETFGGRADLETYLVSRNHAWARLREWQAAPADWTRRENAIAAMSEYHARYADQADRGEALSNPMFFEEFGSPQELVESVVEQTRDMGRRAPHLNRDVAMATGETVTERMENVTQARLAEVDDLGSAPGDVHLARQRTERMEGLALPPAYRGGIHYDEAARVDAPLDVWPENIQQVADYDTLLARTQELTEPPELRTLRETETILRQGLAATEAVAPGLRQARFEARRAVEQAEREVKAATKAETRTPEQVLQDGDEAYQRALAEGRSEIEAGSLRNEAQASVRGAAVLRRDAARALLEEADAAYRPANLQAVKKIQSDIEKTQRQIRNAEEADKAAQPAAEASLQKLLRDRYDQTFSLRSGTDPRAALAAVDAMAGTVQRMGRAAADDVSDAQATAEFARGLQKFQGLLDHLRGDDAAAQRALDRSRLETTKRQMRDPALPRLRDHDLIKRSGGTPYLRETARALSSSQDSAAAIKVIGHWRDEARYTWTRRERMGGHNFTRSLLAVQFGNMLSGTGTLGVNFMGGLVMMPLRLGENALAGAFHGGFRPDTPAAASPKTAAARRLAHAAAAMIPELVNGVKIGFWHWAGEMDPRMGQQIRREEVWDPKKKQYVEQEKTITPTLFGLRKLADEKIQLLDKQGLYEHAARRSYTEETIEGFRLGAPRVVAEKLGGGNDQLRGTIAGLGDVLGTLAGGWVPRTIQGLDVATKIMSGRVQLRHDAATKALEQGLRGAEFKEFVERQVLNAGDDPEAVQRATVMGELNTGMEDPGRLTDWAMQQAQRFPVLRLLLPMPFIRTPGNFLRQATELALAAPLHRLTGERSAILRRFLEEGERIAQSGTPEMKAQLKARATMGMGLMLGMGTLAINGLLSGGTPGDKRIANQRRKLGIKDYSLKVGDSWFEMRNFSGRTSLALQLSADVTELLMSAETREETEIASLLFASAAATMGYAVDETSAQNIMEMAEVLSGNSRDKLDQVAVDWIKDRALRLLGPGSLDRQIARARAGGVEVDFTRPGGMGGADEVVSEKLLEAWLEVAASIRSEFWFSDEENPKIQLWNGEPLSRVYPDGTDGLSRWTIAVGAVGQNKYMEESDDPVAKSILETGWVLQELDDTLLVKDEARAGPGRMPSQMLEYTAPERTLLRQSFGRHFHRTMERKMRTAYWRQSMQDFRASGAANHRAVLHAEFAEARKAAKDYATGQVLAHSERLREAVDEARERMAMQANGGM